MPKLVPKDLSELIRENRGRFTEEVTKQLCSPFSEVEKLASDFHSPTLVLLIARTLVKCVTQADINRIAFILNNACGQLPKTVHVKTNEPQQERLASPLTGVSSEQIIQVLGNITRKISPAPEVVECQSEQNSQSE